MPIAHSIYSTSSCILYSFWLFFSKEQDGQSRSAPPSRGALIEVLCSLCGHSNSARWCSERRSARHSSTHVHRVHPPFSILDPSRVDFLNTSCRFIMAQVLPSLSLVDRKFRSSQLKTHASIPPIAMFLGPSSRTFLFIMTREISWSSISFGTRSNDMKRQLARSNDRFAYVRGFGETL